MIEKDVLLNACKELEGEMTDFLSKLVSFDSLSSYEGPVMEWLYEQFSQVADECEKVPVPESIVDDPDYSFRMGDQPYEGRPNVRVVMKGAGSGKRVLMNTHADVVPPSMGQERPFEPYVEDGRIYGRGTCDDKGQIASVWLLFKAMKKLGLKPEGDVILHIVIEEEVGGNGTLALIREGEEADVCLNLEPTELNVLTSVRGALWFTGTVYGRAGHSGSAGTTVSALKMAIEAMNIIEEYHDDLLKETHGDDPLFLSYANPMPVTFGQLEAGDWPAMAPQKAVFKGVFGILSSPKEEVMAEMLDRVKTRGPEWLKDNFELSFSYKHDTSRMDPDHPAVKILLDSLSVMDVTAKIDAAPYGADAWFYNNFLGIPTMAVGAGSIGDAHTRHENVVLGDVVKLAGAMMLFINGFSGFSRA